MKKTPTIRRIIFVLLISLAPTLFGAEPWPKLNAAQQGTATGQLKKFAENAQSSLETPLKLYESAYFLLYTDMGAGEAKMWNQLLAKMYDRLLEQFNLPKKTNVWHGKAAVFIFQNRDDFKRYETEIENFPDGGNALGACHTLRRGDVRIAFYRQPDTNKFATILVHESVHGFLHRYLTPTPIPTWLNEGLAEWMAVALTPEKEWRQMRIDTARQYLSIHHNTGGMTTTWKSTGAHYGIAYTLTDYLIAQNRKGYVALIRAIKNDKPWEAALEEDYGAGFEKILMAYGRAFGVGMVRP